MATSASVPITPPSGYNFATPQMGVEIYPHNGGQYFFNSATNGGIISAEIGKDIRDRAGGKFSILLAPGGPNGIDDPNSWTNIITLNSLVVIYLSRAGSSRIVMVGVVTHVSESQAWNNRQVVRRIQIIGNDFTYYFSAFSYYTLTYLGLISNVNPAGLAGFILGNFQKQADGPPAELAYLWMRYIMLGVGNTTTPAVMENTYVMYKGQKIYLKQLMGFWFEAFSEDNTVVFVPLLLEMVNSEGSWMDKFLSILAWPFYETFIMTTNSTDYPALVANGTNNVNIPTATLPTNTGGTITIATDSTASFASAGAFPISVTGYPSVYPTIIGRVNPQPWVTYPNKGAAADYGLYYSRWNALTTYSLGNYSYISSNVYYNIEDTANFFGINTVDSAAIANSAGTDSGNMFGFEISGGIISQNSINTYGFRPNWLNLRWLTTFNKIVNPSTFNAGNMNELSSILLGKFASFYIPIPNMLEGQVTIPLWPDVIPSCKFLYNPYKDSSDLYEFYIEGVTHYYEFGGQSYTILDLARGLKQTDYNNTTTLAGVLGDLYARVDGTLSYRTDVATSPGAVYINPSILVSLGAILNQSLSSPGNVSGSSS